MPPRYHPDGNDGGEDGSVEGIDGYYFSINYDAMPRPFCSIFVSTT